MSLKNVASSGSGLVAGVLTEMGDERAPAEIESGSFRGETKPHASCRRSCGFLLLEWETFYFMTAKHFEVFTSD